MHVIALRTEEEILKLKESAKILAKAFMSISGKIEPGVTTGEIDQIAESAIVSSGGRPAFKGYHGYPASICASIDQQVVHGIPGKRKFKNGEIVGIDIGVEFRGYFSDAAKTFTIGEVDAETQRLLKTTKQALYKGIKKCRVGNHLSDISNAIQICVEEKGFSVVQDLVGHGIGTQMHEEPQIPNYGTPGRGPKLKAGMVFAIEPMVNMGGYEVKFLNDGWTVETADGSKSAHFEHTVVITEKEPDIITLGIEQ